MEDYFKNNKGVELGGNKKPLEEILKGMDEIEMSTKEELNKVQFLGDSDEKLAEKHKKSVKDENYEKAANIRDEETRRKEEVNNKKEKEVLFGLDEATLAELDKGESSDPYRDRK